MDLSFCGYFDSASIAADLRLDELEKQVCGGTAVNVAIEHFLVDAQLKRLLDILDRTSAVTSLNISGGSILHDSHCRRLGSFLLGQNAALRSLTLSCSFGEAGSGAARCLESLCSGSELTRLVLKGNVLGRAGCETLAQVLQSADCRIESLCVTNCWLKEDVRPLALALSCNDSVSELDLRENGLRDAGLLSVAQAVVHSGSVRTLWLGRNEVTSSGASALFFTLKNSPSLSALELSFSNIGGAERHLEAFIAEAPQLCMLDLSHCGGGPEVAKAVARALRASAAPQKLKLLGLGGCRMLDEGAIAIAEALANISHQLTHLDLASNWLGSPGLCAIARALLSNATVTRLSLAQNYVSGPSEDALADLLGRSVTLRCVELSRANASVPICAAMCRNGWIRKLELCDELDDTAIKMCVQRNLSMHAACRKCCLTLLAIRKFRWTMLNLMPKELVRSVAEMIFASRGCIDIWAPGR